ncbi:hypothetical protein [Carboxylicivirga taeanensis]|uniref:hypothetical protein n=1 Tax=Carboxylicivirga taeanensis TaxID=1416875 RepID=UPI003F6E2299
MNNNKFKIIIVLLLLSLAIYLFYNPIIYRTNLDCSYTFIKDSYIKGDTLKLIDMYDSEEGSWKIVIVINKGDRKNINKEIPQGKVFETTDTDLIKGIMKNWKFIYTGGDFATIENQLLMYCDNILVFDSGIVLDNSLEGLQNNNFGWIEAVPCGIMSKYIQKFDRVYKPIIIL